MGSSPSKKQKQKKQVEGKSFKKIDDSLDSNTITQGDKNHNKSEDDLPKGLTNGEDKIHQADDFDVQVDMNNSGNVGGKKKQKKHVKEVSYKNIDDSPCSKTVTQGKRNDHKSDDDLTKDSTNPEDKRHQADDNDVHADKTNSDSVSGKKATPRDLNGNHENKHTVEVGKKLPRSKSNSDKQDTKSDDKTGSVKSETESKQPQSESRNDADKSHSTHSNCSDKGSNGENNETNYVKTKDDVWEEENEYKSDEESKNDITRNMNTSRIVMQPGVKLKLEQKKETTNNHVDFNNAAGIKDNKVEQTTNVKDDSKQNSRERDVAKGKETAKKDAKQKAKERHTSPETPKAKEKDTDINKGTEKKNANNKSNERQTSTETSKATEMANNTKLNDNLKFYKGQINSKPPPGAKIDEMHKWKGDYIKLERDNSYIQWLFPSTESSFFNSSSQVLQEHEAKAIREDTHLRKKVLKSFRMMLDFYGMVLQDERKGKFEKNHNWKDRYDHLNKSMRNWLRITRIIKSLGELGWEHLQALWVEFLILEVFEGKELPKLTNCSSMEYWIDAVKDEAERSKCFELYAAFKEKSAQPNKDEHKKNDKKDTTINKRKQKVADI